MMRLVDFFDQISDFLQWFHNLWNAGLSNLDELPKIFTYCSNFLQDVLNFVHPAFLPVISFAICCSLLFRFLRL